MPRKVVPRWGKTGVMKVPSFTLSEEQFTELSGLLSPSSQLKATLEWIGARYLLWLQQDERGPSQAERNAALKQLLGTPQELEPMLAKLDYATQDELLDVLWARLIASGRKLVLLDQIARDDPELVIDCATYLLAQGKKRRGPARRKTLPIIIRWLASMYEETTGRTFTHTPYVKTKYKGTPQSHGGQFVTAFLKMVDPKLPKTAIPPKWRALLQPERAGIRAFLARYKLSNRDFIRQAPDLARGHTLWPRSEIACPCRPRLPTSRPFDIS